MYNSFFVFIALLIAFNKPVMSSWGKCTECKIIAAIFVCSWSVVCHRIDFTVGNKQIKKNYCVLLLTTEEKAFFLPTNALFVSDVQILWFDISVTHFYYLLGTFLYACLICGRVLYSHRCESVFVYFKTHPTYDCDIVCVFCVLAYVRDFRWQRGSWVIVPTSYNATKKTIWSFQNSTISLRKGWIGTAHNEFKKVLFTYGTIYRYWSV